jgi:hypothetical protein
VQVVAASSRRDADRTHALIVVHALVEKSVEGVQQVGDLTVRVEPDDYELSIPVVQLPSYSNPNQTIAPRKPAQ